MKSYLLLIALGLSLTAGAQDSSDERFVGPPIDVSTWQYQRALKFDHEGTVALDIDATIFVRTSIGLNDLRVVRMGRQIPFVATRPGVDREMDVTVAEVIDPKAPLLSKWDIALPSRGFPMSALRLQTTRSAFTYTLRVTEMRETDKGPQEQVLGNSVWSRREGEAATPFQLVLKTMPSGGTIRMTATDGSTPRLQITAARIKYPLIRLVFRVPDKEPVYLCYGNAQAINPRYDLQLTRADFPGGAESLATLGPEEKPSNQYANVNKLVGNVTWNLDTIKFKILALVEQFDRSNPWHMAGLVVGVMLLVKILSRILFGRRS